jgi:hypothetical protein
MFAPMVLGLASIPGNTSYSTPGTYNFTVPEYTTLTVVVTGARGGNGQVKTAAGGTGGYSSFNSTVIGYGGTGGSGMSPGVGGTASGGDTNVTGANGIQESTMYHASTGGYGGTATKLYTSGLVSGSTITVVVGAMGWSPDATSPHGSVVISWT